MKKKGFPIVYVVAIAVLVALGGALLLFQSASVAQPVSTIRADWTMLEEPVGVSAGVPSALELTVYQTGQEGGFARPLEFNYNSGLALVKEKRAVELPVGISWIALKGVSSHVDPTSISFKDSSDSKARVLEQNYDYDLVSQEKLLQKYVGKKIVVKTENESIEGVLLSTGWGGIVLETPAGIVTITSYRQIVYPVLPEGLLTTPTISWQVESSLAGKHDLQLAYLTSGVSWSADYVATVDSSESSLDLQGWVSVKNDAGTAFKEARLKLIAGDVNLVSQKTTPYYPYPVYAETAGAPARAAAPQFTQQSFFEYHLYSLERLTTIKDGELKQINFLTATGVPVVKELVFEPTNSDQVRAELEFENKKANSLGIALPKGRVRVLKPDSSAQLQFLGEDRIDHTPDGEKVRLLVGSVFDVTGERSETQHDQIGNCITERSYDIKLSNAKKTQTEVTVLEPAYGEWEIRTSNYPYTKESAHVVSWKIPVAAGADSVLSYTIRERWC